MAPNVALNTSKRKFYKLLDNLSSSRANISNSEPKHVSTATPANEPPQKRLRSFGSERPFTAPSPALRPSTSVRAVGGTAGNARPMSQYETPESERRPVNYAPWDHERFLARLKTFADVMTWTPKPSQISEVEWAKRGWVVVGKDMVACKGGCEKRLVVTLDKEPADSLAEGKGGEEEEEGVETKKEHKVMSPTDAEDELWWMDDVEKELVNKYSALIVEGHDVDCMWRKHGCKDDIYRIKMADPMVWQKELRERYLSLMAVGPSLPDVWSIHEEGAAKQRTLDLDEISKSLPRDLFKQAPAGEETADAAKTNDTAGNKDVTTTAVSARESPNYTALALALCGWSAQSPHGVQLAYCTKCFQRIGLWLYHKSDSEPSSASTPKEAMTFNPIELHREHCPWANPKTQNSVGLLAGLAGWEVLVKLVKGGRRRFGEAEEKEVKAQREQSRWSDDDDDDDEHPRKTKEELEAEDKARRSRIQRLKRVFSVKKKDKK
jgi:hypothetical protein